MKQEALKLALEALENSEYGDYDKEELNKAITAIKEALAQHDSVQAKPEPEQEPRAWINWSALTGEPRLGWECESELASEPLYITPPQRKPLTKDRTMEIANQTAGQYWMDEAHIQRFRAAVEADHGIQENT